MIEFLNIYIMPPRTGSARSNRQARLTLSASEIKARIADGHPSIVWANTIELFNMPDVTGEANNNIGPPFTSPT